MIYYISGFIYIFNISFFLTYIYLKYGYPYFLKLYTKYKKYNIKCSDIINDNNKKDNNDIEINKYNNLAYYQSTRSDNITKNPVQIFNSDINEILLNNRLSYIDNMV